MRCTLGFLILVFLTACGVPFRTVPLGEVELEPLLTIQQGDLPAGMTGAQVKAMAPPGIASLPGFPQPTKAIDQQFARAGQTAGGVVVLLYDSLADAERAYTVMTNDLKNGGGRTRSGYVTIGDQSMDMGRSDTLLGVNLDTAATIFQHCHAVVAIQLGGTSNPDDSVSYAKRLDTRLKPVVCR